MGCELSACRRGLKRTQRLKNCKFSCSQQGGQLPLAAIENTQQYPSNLTFEIASLGSYPLEPTGQPVVVAYTFSKLAGIIVLIAYSLRSLHVRMTIRIETLKTNISPIVIDKVTDEDKFEGGGHRRTAEQFCRIIREFASQGENRSIGLYGDWGSGKSSVVEMAKKRLSSGEINYRFFTFDLWSANAANFKRSLLEELLDWASLERPERLDDFESQRDKVRDREIVTTSDISLKLSTFGLFFLILLPFIPIAYSWLGPESFNEKNRVLKVPLTNIEATGWFVAVFLFFVLFCGAAIALVTHWCRSKNFRESASHLMSMVSHKEKTNTVTQNIREKDPNEHEFETLFRRLLQDIQDDGSRVVLIFDNIDRLPQHEIASYWALVRSVFSTSSSVKPAKHQQCLVVVPYEKSVIEDVFSATGKDHDFLSKTFDANLRVAQPVLSNVSDFLQSILRERFGTEISEDDLNAVTKIFEYFANTSQNSSMTPRRVISFVNEVVDLAATWNEQVGLPTIAIYVTNRNDIESDPKVLQSDDGPVMRFLRFDPSPTPTKYLAALTYNVDPDLAYQTLLEPDLIRALLSGDAPRVSKLEESEGFVQIFQNVLQYRSGDIAGEGVEALSCLSACADRVLRDNYSRKQSSNDILSALERLPNEKSWEVATIEKLGPILKLLRDQPKTDVIPPLVKWISAPIGIEPGFEIGKKWASAAEQVIGLLEVNAFGDQLELSKYFDRPVSATFALGVAGSESRSKLKIEPLKSLFADGDLKDALLLHAEGNPSSVPSVALGLKLASKFTQDISSSVLAVLKIALCESKIEDVEQVVDLTKSFADTYAMADKVKANKAVLDELIQHGGFVWHIHHFCSEGTNSALLSLALELAILQLKDQDFALKPNQNIGGAFGNFHESSQWFQQILTGNGKISDETIFPVAQRRSVDSLLYLVDLAASSRSHAKTVKRVVDTAASVEQRELLYVDAILEREDWLRNNSPALFFAMLKDIKENITDKEIAEINLQSLSPDFLSDALSTGGNSWKVFDKAIAKKFNDQTEDEWTKILVYGGNPARLLDAKLEGLGEKVTAKASSFITPFENYYLGLLSGEKEVSFGFGDKLLRMVSKPARLQITRAIAQKFAGCSYTPETFKLVSDEFPDLTKLVIESADFASASVVVSTKLLASGGKENLEVLFRHAESFSKHLDSANTDELAALTEVLEEKRGSADDSDTIVQLASALGITLSVSNEDDG
jgi:KAP family P-loop domain